MIFISENLSFLLPASAILLLLVWVIRLEIKLRRFLQGKDAKNLEDLICETLETVKQTDRINEEITEHLLKVEERLRRSVQHVKTIRFNPFKGDGSGGDQSFSTAFVNEEGDGVVISSLYSRDRVSVFAKPIKKLSSEYEMTKEEKESLNKAKDSAQA